MQNLRGKAGKALALAAACLPLSVVRLAAAVPVEPPVVEYTMQVSLDPKEKILDGTEKLVWRNPSGDLISELRFHLYLNAFKNNRTTFMRESGGRLRGDEAGNKPEDWGWIDVSSMKTSAGVELRTGARFIQPDGNDPSDETVLLVPLPSPVAPHGEITLDIAFRSKLPKIFARTGFVRDYFLVGQWYPKIGVYETAGMRGRTSGGWNCHAFHANSEFYADYGNFDVTFSVPSRFVVGATGKRASETKTGDRTAYRYVQNNVHDFAWTADPRTIAIDFSFDPAVDIPKGWSEKAAKELGMTEAAIALKPVSCRLLLQPGNESLRERYIRSTKEALSYYGLYYGAYPYETLTVVDPPFDGEGSGGMEYPTFITGGGFPAFMKHWPFQNVRVVELVTIHEFGHQYWYGMVGSNEFEESWLDEGLNTDSEYRTMMAAYGPRDDIQLPGGLGLDSISIAHGEYAHLPNLDPIDRCAWCFSSGNAYGVNSYPKVGLFMAQLKNDLGAEVFSRAQRAYFQQWSFRHPNTSDFFDTFERVSGRDLSTYRLNLVDGASRLDWQVVSAKTSTADGDYGVFDRNGKQITYEDGEIVKPEPKEGAAHKDKKNKDRGPYSTTVLFGNTGEWQHGAKARMVFEDGVAVDRDLPGAARWVRYRVRYKSKLAYAVVDPDRLNVWDWNHLNDSKVLGTGKGAASNLGKRAAVKYSGWTAYLLALWTQILWTLA